MIDLHDLVLNLLGAFCLLSVLAGAWAMTNKDFSSRMKRLRVAFSILVMISSLLLALLGYSTFWLLVALEFVVLLVALSMPTIDK